MKSSKNKNSQNKKGGDASTPKIDTYFKAAAKQFDINIEETNMSDVATARDSYIDALKKKLEGLTSETHDCQGTGDGKSACETQNFGATEYRAINEENAVASSVAASTKTVGNPHKQSESEEPCKRCKEWEGKYNDLQKLCLRLTIRNSEMDLKYEDLLKTKTGANQFVAVSNMTVADTDVHFTARELKFLECMSLEKKFDSTFVHHCLQFAYKDNLQVLTQKSLKGTAEVVLIAENGDVEKTIPGKDPLTPVKIEKIRSLFIERISKCQLNPVAYSERIKDAYLNRLIGSGVTNIAKKKYESL